MRLIPVEHSPASKPIPAHDAQWTARRNAVGLREMFAIAASWRITQEQLGKLLGTAPRSLQRWRTLAEASGELELSADTLERMSYLLGISKALKILLPTPDNRLLWLRNPNASAWLGGQAPLDRMLQGQVADLFMVRRYLDAARG